MEDTVFRRYSIAIVTPFHDSIDQDISDVAPIVAHTCIRLASLRSMSNSIGGIIVSGSTGEQHAMTKEERIRLYRDVVNEADKYGVPVACGVAATTTKVARELAAGAVVRSFCYITIDF